jgi:hypothetical protein
VSRNKERIYITSASSRSWNCYRRQHLVQGSRMPACGVRHLDGHIYSVGMRPPTLNENGGYRLPLHSFGCLPSSLIHRVNRLSGFRKRSLAKSVDNFETHLAGRAGDDAEGGFITSRIQVLRLCLNDIHDLLARYLADLRLVRFFGTSGDVCRFL